MNTKNNIKNPELPNGVMLNAYPDSIGLNLSDTVNLLKNPEFKDVFSLFYILPTFFNSDLDRGFSVIDYDINEELVSPADLQDLHKLNIEIKFDLVLNHLSVGSPQFKDLLENGDESKYKSFFIDWNEFWESNGKMGPDGYIIPKKKYLDKLFMRKPGLPILKVHYPDGSERPYWNTFYQEINYSEINADELLETIGSDKLNTNDAKKIAELVNEQLQNKVNIDDIEFGEYSNLKEDVVFYLQQNRTYLGQMDLNAKSPLVWEFYDETFKKLSAHGGKLIRLDAFAYLHKEPGKSNFFNKPGTWEYLSKLKKLAEKYNLTLLPEIHSVYGSGLYEEVANNGYPIYDFFFPGLVIHAIEWGTNKYLLNWIKELLDKKIKTINMLGCHDGIPVLDLKGEKGPVADKEGILSDIEIDKIVDRILARGGRVKNLYGADGKKISYYQVNATFFSTLGEDERKLLLARAIQIFMPGIPQVWYLDLFAGKNDYAAADLGGTGGHKEINRTTLTQIDIENGQKSFLFKHQITLLKLRNTLPAFNGELSISDNKEDELVLTWKNGESEATLNANLSDDYSFNILYTDRSGIEKVISF
jgi:sucrose phosphorylase